MFRKFCGSRKSKGGDVACSVHFQEETYGLATKIIGLCSRTHRPRRFVVDPERVGSTALINACNANARLCRYALNYQLSAAIQATGCGLSDAKTLVSFLGLPSATIMQRLLQTSERVLGPIQMALTEESMKDGINEEISLAKSEVDFAMDDCCIEGEDYGSLPILSVSYGNVDSNK